MSILSKDGYRCIAPDLKEYSQSEKKLGDYRHEGAAENLFSMLKQIGLTKLNLVAHDRGAIQADYITIKYSESVLRHSRGEQHLYHFNPALALQGDVFIEAPYTGIMENPTRFVV